MHIFLYKADRHTKRSAYGRSPSQSSIRSDFNLAMMRQGLRNKYEIKGYGINDFQRKLKLVGLEDEMYGHLIEIEEAKYAVWLKLNYDQVGKTGTTYKGAWKNLDPAFLDPFIAEYEKHSKKSKELYTSMSLLRSQKSNLEYFGARRDMEHLRDRFINEMRVYGEHLASISDEITAEYDVETKAMRDIQNKIRAYMKEHAL